MIGVARVGLGPLHRPGSREGAAGALCRPRNRPAETGHGLRDANRDRLARRRDRRDRPRKHLPGLPRDARRADRGGSRGRAARLAPRAVRAPRRCRSRLRSALCSAALRRVGDRRVRHAAAARDRPRCGSSASSGWRCSHPRSCRRSRRRSAGPERGLGGVAGTLARENAMRNPGADRLDGGGADDRARARQRGRRARIRHQGDLRARGRRAIHRRLRVDLGERVHTDRGCLRERRCARAGRRRRLGRASRRRAGVRAQRPDHGRRAQRRPGDQDQVEGGRPRVPAALGLDGAFVDASVREEAPPGARFASSRSRRRGKTLHLHSRGSSTHRRAARRSARSRSPRRSSTGRTSRRRTSSRS